MSIKLEDSDSEVAPVPAGKIGHIIEPEMDVLGAHKRFCGTLKLDLVICFKLLINGCAGI